MNDQLAQQLLAAVLGDEERSAVVRKSLQQLAVLKYDEYEGYRAGERFLESLATWLGQFRVGPEREAALRLVREHLIFISRAELDHLIETVYPDHIRPALVDSVAASLGVSPFRVRQVTKSREFLDLQRKTLVFGMADGARLDRLRRASPDLSHEQFYLTFEVTEQTQASMRSHLTDAVERLALPGPAVFRQVIVVDDFGGSGSTATNKLAKLRQRLEDLTAAGIVTDGCPVWVLLYVATRAAVDNLAAAVPSWKVSAVQLIGDALKITDTDILELSKVYFDPILDDADMRTGNAPGHLGYAGAALPLVLHHNSPNNSLGILWGDTTERPESGNRRALFPRRTRHREDRP